MVGFPSQAATKNLAQRELASSGQMNELGEVFRSLPSRVIYVEVETTLVSPDVLHLEAVGRLGLALGDT